MHSNAKWLYLSTLGSMLTVFGLAHQKFFTSTGWFNWEQFWHHEPLIAMAFVTWIILLVVFLTEGKWDKRQKDKREWVQSCIKS